MWHPLYTWTNNPEVPIVVTTVKTGTGGIDKKRRNPVKPTGLTNKKTVQKSINHDIIDERLKEQEQLAVDFVELAEKVTKPTLKAKAIPLSELDLEIGMLLKKKLDEEKRIAMMLILLAANL
jgi:hypothetical protein